MSGETTVVWRRLALFGPPAALALLSLTHPLAQTTRDLAPQAEWFISLHVLQLVLFGLIGLGAYLLTIGLDGPLVVASRLGLAVFVVFLGAWDAIAGIATGILIRTARGLPLDQQDAAFGLSEALFRDPLVGGASIGVFSIVGGLGAMLGLVAAALALRHAGAPKLPCVLIGGAGLTFLSGHLPTAPVSLALLLAGTALLERRDARVASHLAARDGLREDPSIVVPTIRTV